ncbi:MAG: Phosphatidate cytidylyltransferase, partial [uncultured Sphingosinicella sp.]
ERRRRGSDPQVRSAYPIRDGRSDDRCGSGRHLCRRLAVPPAGACRRVGDADRMGGHAPRAAHLGLSWHSAADGAVVDRHRDAVPGRTAGRVHLRCKLRSDLAGLRGRGGPRIAARARHAAADNGWRLSLHRHSRFRAGRAQLGLVRDPFLGHGRDLVDRHLRLLRRPLDRRPEACASDQPEQNLGGARRRRCGGGDRRGFCRLCVGSGLALLSVGRTDGRDRAGRRPLRKLDEAPRGGEGQRDVTPGARRRARSARRAAAGCRRHAWAADGGSVDRV